MNENAAAVAVREGGLLPCEDLPGEAVQTRVPDPILVPRPDGGATALLFHRASSRAEDRRPPLVFCDLSDGTSRIEPLPEGFSNPWSQMWGPDGRLYFGLWGPATLLRYDPARDAVDAFGVIEPDPPYKGVPILTIGTDEKVYAIAGGWVFSLDPATDTVERYGRQGPPRRYPIAYTGSLAVDDEYIYSTFGNIEDEVFTVAMNKATREQTLLTDIPRARFVQGRLGVTAQHEGRTYWMVKGKPVAQAAPDEKPPWPDRPLAERTPAPRFAGRPEVVSTRRVGEEVELAYRLEVGGPVRTLRYPMPAAPVGLSRVWALPDGRVCASTAGYDGLYAYDTKTGAFGFLGALPQSHYSTLAHGDVVLLAGYPGGSGLFVWDPKRPWTIGTEGARRDDAPESNPRRMEPWARSGNFQFPLAMALSADGTVFAAIHGERSHVGGTLSWRRLEPDAGGVLRSRDAGFLRAPFELYDPSGLCAVMDGTKLALSTFAVAGGRGEPRPKEGRLFLLDAATRQVEWFLDPLPGIDCAGHVVEARPGQLVLATDHRTGWRFDRWKEGEFHGSVLYRVDLNERKVVQRVDLPGTLAGRRDYSWNTDFRKGPDGNIYTYYDDLLVRIHPETLAITAVSRVGATGQLCFVGQDVYLAALPHLRRVKDALAP